MYIARSKHETKEERRVWQKRVRLRDSNRAAPFLSWRMKNCQTMWCFKISLLSLLTLRHILEELPLLLASPNYTQTHFHHVQPQPCWVSVYIARRPHILLRASYLTPLSAHATPTPKALLFIQNTRRSDGHDGVGKLEAILQSAPYFGEVHNISLGHRMVPIFP